MSESLVRMAAELSGYDGDLGEKGRHGILRDIGSRKGFLEDPAHRIEKSGRRKRRKYLLSANVKAAFPLIAILRLFCAIKGNYRADRWKNVECRMILSDHSHNFYSCGNIRFACAEGLPPSKSRQMLKKILSR